MSDSKSHRTKTSFQDVLGNVKRNVSSHLGYLLFLTALLAFLLYYLSLTFDMSRRETWLLPRVTIIFGILFVIADMVRVTFFNYFRELLNWDEFIEDKDDNPLEKVRSDDYDSGIWSLVPFGLIREVGWIFAYLAALYYIGFFTGTFLFIFFYIITHLDRLNVRTVSKSIGISLVINGFLWVLFVYIMGTASIFRLGILP